MNAGFAPFLFFCHLVKLSTFCLVYFSHLGFLITLLNFYYISLLQPPSYCTFHINLGNIYVTLNFGKSPFPLCLTTLMLNQAILAAKITALHLKQECFT